MALRRVLALIFRSADSYSLSLGCWPPSGAPNLYLALGGGAGAVGRAQVWGRAQRAAVATALVGLSASCARSDFPAGGLVLFIPWRLAAERGAEFSI